MLNILSWYLFLSVYYLVLCSKVKILPDSEIIEFELEGMSILHVLFYLFIF